MVFFNWLRNLYFRSQEDSFNVEITFFWDVTSRVISQMKLHPAQTYDTHFFHFSIIPLPVCTIPNPVPNSLSEVWLISVVALIVRIT
jgi:hypothetical protein